MNQTDEQEQADTPDIDPTHLAAVFGATDVPIFAYLGYALFDDPVFGGVVGLLVGGGIFLFLPSILQAEGDTDTDTDATGQHGEIDAKPADGPESAGGFHRAGAGIALTITGFGLLSWRFVSDDILVGAGGALVVAALSYVVLSNVLPESLGSGQ